MAAIPTPLSVPKTCFTVEEALAVAHKRDADYYGDWQITGSLYWKRDGLYVRYFFDEMPHVDRLVLRADGSLP